MSRTKPLSVPHERRDEIETKVRSALRQKCPELADYWQPKHVQHVLNWPSVRGALTEPELTDSLIADIVRQAVAYAPSRILRQEAQKRQKSRPALKLDQHALSSAHGVAYYLGLAVMNDPDVFAEIRQVRQLIAQDKGLEHSDGAPPFPWLTARYESSRQEAAREAQEWLFDCEGREASLARISIQVETRSLEDLQRYWNDWSEREAEHFPHKGPYRLPEYLRALADEVERWPLALAVPTHKLAGLNITLGEVRPEGRKQLHLIHSVTVPDGSSGLLNRIYSLVKLLSARPGWTARLALSFILTGEPPMPSGALRTELEKQKPMSLDHIAVLQLVYMTGHAQERGIWPRRVRIWDNWLQKEEGLRNRLGSFTGNQRAKSLRAIYVRARADAQRRLRKVESLLPVKSG